MIHLLSVSIFHNNMPTQTKSINEGLSQKVLMEMSDMCLKGLKCVKQSGVS